MILLSEWQAKTWELRYPLVGLRHNQQPIVVGHRFPIRDGLSYRQVLMWKIRTASRMAK